MPYDQIMGDAADFRKTEDKFIVWKKGQESSSWDRMRQAKNRRICASMRHVVDSISGEHKLEHKNLRHDERRARHMVEKEARRLEKLEISEFKAGLVEQVMRKREEQIDSLERRYIKQQQRSEETAQGALRHLEKRNAERAEQMKVQDAARAGKKVLCDENLLEKNLRWSRQRSEKAKKHRKQQALQGSEASDRSHAVRMVKEERRLMAQASKQALDREREGRHEEEWQLAEKREVKRAKQAAALARQRKDVERTLWVEAAKSKESIGNFARSGKPNRHLLQAVREAQDSALESDLDEAVIKLEELSLVRRSIATAGSMLGSAKNDLNRSMDSIGGGSKASSWRGGLSSSSRPRSNGSQGQAFGFDPIPLHSPGGMSHHSLASPVSSHGSS